MMWFFAVLIVVAMGGVAVIAAGKGSPLAEEYGDRPDALVPAEGRVGSDDLRRVRFSLAFRGYRMSEVDALLDRLATELEAAGKPAEATKPDAAQVADDEKAEAEKAEAEKAEAEKGKNAEAEQGGKPEAPDTAAADARPGKPDRGDKADKADKADKPDKPDKADGPAETSSSDTRPVDGGRTAT
ncbi:MAG: DivIVA domain-containing protein [Nocardioidaceae bacterium]